MKTAIEYLEDAEKKLGTVGNDSATARALKTTPQSIHNYKKGHSKMDDYHCIRVAQVLGIDPIEIIAAVQEEREKSSEKKEFWRDFREAREREKGVILVPLMVIMTLMLASALFFHKPLISNTLSIIGYQDIVYIMSNLVTN
ncbi:hypothetical protein HZU77_016425 [Neisseriaceae bacterium TC5R-5]|nr:hypothetical protein [Neisseriaceae bacterium TC5R-5]